MESSGVAAAPDVLKLLADDRRWSLVRALAHGDRRVQELVAAVRQPANLVSYHLRRLREQAVVTERRSAADRRDVYYSLAFDRVRDLYLAAAGALHPALGPAVTGAAAAAGRAAPAARPKLASVLFVCTHNSARSQMAEGFLRHMRRDLTVASAGTAVSRVQPLAIRVMRKRGIDISRQRSQHLSEYAGQRFDHIVTVCDRAREACPVFPGDPELLHWSIGDPAAVTGDAAARRQAYEAVADELQGRIRRLLALLLLDQR
jgi:protein-tyrosine-phosphatase/DNA-binding transcriptional ArsR family regulator